MLEATIVSPRGSLYLAAEATPYDVQELRSHVRALCTPAADVCLTLRLSPNARARVGELVASLAAGLAREGVSVSINDEHMPQEMAPHRAFVAKARSQGDGLRHPTTGGG
jgi:hypothetical protein